MTTTANDFLLAGGTPSARFPTVGTTVAGTVVRVGDPVQQRDFDSGEPKTWDNGDPMMQLPVDVQTDQRDPDLTDDDGVRTLYIKAQLKKAVADAVRKAKAKGLEVGGTLSVTYASDGEVKKRGMNPPKVYTATYTPPAAAADAFLAAEPAAKAETTAPDPAAVAAALAALTPEQRAGLGLA